MKNEKNKNEQLNEQSNELSLKNEIIGIVFLFVSIFLIFSVVSYSPSDPSFFNATPVKRVDNFAGPVGAQLSAILFNLFGYAVYVIIFYLLFITIYFLVNKRIPTMISKSAGYLLLLISLSALTCCVMSY